jgi:SAM-dependent methyltransferase
VIAAYRHKFNIPVSMPITAEMIRQHWRIERRGARSILDAAPEARAAIAAAAYTHVFGECSWLNAADGGDRDPDVDFSHFIKLLRGAQKIYEVGSGKGELIAWLAGNGFVCVGTEITPERGSKHTSDTTSLTWHTTDGVNLLLHEEPASFDVVLSVQVIEHLHPDDLPAHFVAAAALLRGGGRYVLATPHRLSGPADLSAAFALEAPVCFHLREYDYNTLTPLLRRCGFARIQAVYTTPRRLKRMLDVCFASRFYLTMLRAAERLLDRLPVRVARRIVGVLHKFALWRPDVFLVAEKIERSPS